jgi:predicted negative regulator of RcsB-dependent stress response
MEIYSTEEQQAEAIKRFFKENGVSLALGIVIGLGGLYAWKAYNQNQIESAESASDAYNQLVEGEQVLEQSETFIKDNANSNYASLAAFVAVKEAVEQNKLDIAVNKLNWIVSNVKNVELQATALLRLARVQLAQEKYDDAIKTLNSTMPKSFKAQIAEIKGDVYLAKGDKAQAKTQYQTAIDVADKDNAGLLQIKLEDLATTQSVAE